MQLFYEPDFGPPCGTLGEEESKHCVRVLRLAEGDRLHVTDGRGTLYECRVVAADPRRCEAEVVTVHADFEPLPYRLVMGVAPAMKQSLKAYRPGLEPLTPLREVLEAPFEGRKFIAHCAEARNPAGKAYLPSTLRPGEAALVLIGPEGDFSPAEIDAALACGFEEITLGPQRLRTETAAVVAVTMAAVVNQFTIKNS